MGDLKAPPPPAGWYPDDNGRQRYFDGTAWTDRTPPRINRRVLVWLIVAYTLAAAGFIYAWWPYGTWPL